MLGSDAVTQALRQNLYRDIVAFVRTYERWPKQAELISERHNRSTVSAGVSILARQGLVTYEPGRTYRGRAVKLGPGFLGNDGRVFLPVSHP